MLSEFTDQASHLLVNYTKFRKAVVFELSKMGIEASPGGALTDRKSSHAQGSSTLSPFMRGANSTQLENYKAAGVSSRRTKCTASDAVNGYQKFESKLGAIWSLQHENSKFQIMSSHNTPRQRLKTGLASVNHILGQRNQSRL